MIPDKWLTLQTVIRSHKLCIGTRIIYLFVGGNHANWKLYFFFLLQLMARDLAWDHLTWLHQHLKFKQKPQWADDPARWVTPTSKTTSHSTVPALTFSTLHNLLLLSSISMQPSRKWNQECGFVNAPCWYWWGLGIAGSLLPSNQAKCLSPLTSGWVPLAQMQLIIEWIVAWFPMIPRHI